jgi:hypothetical protein
VDYGLIIGPPSPPINLTSTVTLTAPNNITVRLDWDPPLDSGRVTIVNYLISLNMSQQVFSTDTNTTFTLNSTGEHLIEISAVNNCGILGDDVSAVINITGN